MSLDMKVIAMYLPQFHRTAENDMWWGEGYTEWTATKAAETLYEEHYQPKVPLNDNYYDLLEKETMQWQAKLMKEYNVYGMCMYHYWFGEGRKVLEKPAENLLKWKDIDMPFCFSWANQTWARTWSKMTRVNVWFKEEKCGVEKKDADKGILLEQKYGEEADWKEHFEYLLPFFMDERYIKIDGKPIFIIYHPEDIVCGVQMFSFWNELAQKNGLKGIYLIGTNSSRNSLYDAYMHQEPGRHLQEECKLKNDSSIETTRYSYDKVWEKILLSSIPKDSKVYLGGFVGFDDTPRRGRSGKIIQGAAPEKFYRYLKKLLKKSEQMENEYVFINAWNEWGEGMYLEPDKRYEYAYLEAVKNALADYKDESMEMMSCNDMDEVYEKRIDKYKGLWTILDRWLSLKEEGTSFESYFKERNIETVAVYGIGMLGKHLLKEMENTSIQVKYGIDRSVDNTYFGFPIVKPEAELENVDAIIVTACYEFYDIYMTLKEKYKGNIISLEEIIKTVAESS